MFLSKKITSLIISLLIISSSMSVTAFASDTLADIDETKEIFNSDSTSATKAYFSNTYAALNQDVFENNDMSLKLTGTGDNASESRNPTFTAQDWTGYNYINFRMKNAGETDGKFTFYATVNKANANGVNGYWTKGGIAVVGSEWQTISIPIPSGFTFTYSTAPTIYTEMSHIEGLRFDYINGIMYLEKIWLSKTEPESTKFIGASVPDGYDEVSVGSASFEFIYSHDLAPVDKQNANISFTSNDGDVAFDVNYSQNTITIVPLNNLEYNTAYSISISGVRDYNSFGISGTAMLSFTTTERDVSVSALTLGDIDGNSITELPERGIVTASAKVFNPTDSAETITLVLALYGSDGKMLMDGSAFETVTVEPGQDDAYVTVQIESDDYSGKTVCAFVIDSKDKRNLISSQYAQLPAAVSDEPSETAYGAANELTLTTFDYANDTAVIEASLNGGMKRTLLVSVLSDDGIIHMLPFHNTADGKVNASFAMTNDNSTGGYTMEISGRKVNNQLSQKFYHLNKNDKQTVFDTANSLSNVADGTALLKDYKEVFQLDDSVVDDDILMHMTAEALSYNKPYEDFESIKSFVKKASDVCAELNSQSWDTLADFVITNENILIGDANIEYFKNLSSTNRNKTCRYIDSFVFESLEDLYNKLSDAVDEYKDSLVSNSGSSGSGSGSSRPSSSGGGGYSVQTPSVIVPPADTPETPAPETNSETYSFADLAGFDWAEKSINALAANGVISKPDNKNFRPADMITRAEFVKLLVCAMYDSAEIASSEFSDIDKNDWSYPYISIAHRYGLINGREDGSFGKNDCITRQEMAAVIHRALVHKNVSFASGLSEFAYSDDNSISDYAKTAVYALYHSGIMSGMGDGRFAADANANRAQAACVIDRLQKGVHNE